MTVDAFRKYQFDQTEILSMMQGVVKGTPAAKGICQELCWKWMKRLRTKAEKYGTPKERMEALWKEATVNKAIARHNLANQLSVPQEFYNIEKNHWQQKWGYDKAMEDQWRNKGGGLFISLTCPKYNDGKHAISFYTPPSILASKVFFFDPNEGEYEMNFSKYYTFLPEFLSEKYNATLNNIVETVAYGTPNQVGKI